MTTDFGWISVCPGTFDQGTPGMGIPGLGHATLLTPPPTGIFRGREPQIIHELSRVLKACEVTQFRHGGHRHGELDTAQGLEGLDHRGQTPGGDLLVTVLFKPPEAFRVFGDGPPVCLANALRRRRRTDDLR